VNAPATFEVLAEQHLDLRPLRGRRRGVTTCPFHKDRTPSLSIDLDQAVFNCFGCGASGGALKFARLLGDSGPKVVMSTPHPTRTLLQAARAETLEGARRAREKLAPWLPIFRASDLARPFLRLEYQTVLYLRTTAGAVGTDDDRTWKLLELAAEIERNAQNNDAELNDMISSTWRARR
jgi:hypothetical protein